MYDLFARRFEGSMPVVKPPAFELIRRTYQREIDTIVSYYNSRVYAVRGNHLLCRLLMTASVPIEYELGRFMDVIYARAPYVAKHFKFTSAIDYGTLHDGVFYGIGNRELIFYDEEYFNPFEAVQNWKTLKPIKVLAHQISDLGLLLPDGRVGSTGQGFCSISINVPMLLCMYRGFLLAQKARFDSDANVQQLLGVNHFVHMYVLPGMMQSHIEQVLMNRLVNVAHGLPHSSALRKHPFPVVDYGDRMDTILEEVAGRLKDANKSYYWYLQSIPSIFEESMQESLIMPDMSRTRQAWWALNLSRLGVMSFLLDIGGEDGVHNNGTFINKAKRTAKYLIRENMLKSLLPADMYYSVDQALTNILTV